VPKKHPLKEDKRGPGYKYYLKIAGSFQEWWEEWNTTLDKKGKLKYRSVWQFAQAKTRNKKEQNWVVQMIGPEPKTPSGNIAVPWLGDWKQRRQSGYSVPIFPSEIRNITRALKDKLANVEAVKSLAPYVVQSMMQYERLMQQVNDLFGGQVFDINYPPHHQVNVMRWQRYSVMLKEITLMENQALGSVQGRAWIQHQESSNHGAVQCHAHRRSACGRCQVR
jgi:hypothetical protein